MYMLSEIIIFAVFPSFSSSILCHKFYTGMTNKFVEKKNNLLQWNEYFLLLTSSIIFFTFLLNVESMNQNTLLIHPLNQYKEKRKKGKLLIMDFTLLNSCYSFWILFLFAAKGRKTIK